MEKDAARNYLNPLDSTEYLVLRPGPSQWNDGPTLPKHLLGAVCLTSPDGTGILIVGGYNDEEAENKLIYLLQHSRADGFQWSTVAELSGGRVHPVAMLIPDPVDCPAG